MTNINPENGEQEKKDKTEKKEKVITYEVTKADLTKEKITVIKQVLKNTKGEDVPDADYFFKGENKEVYAPNYFNQLVGYPVDPEFEEVISIFDSIFKPEDNFLLLKKRGQEVYSVVVPVAFATELMEENDPRAGEAQIHTISFTADGGFNTDKFRTFLQRVVALIDYKNK